LILIKKCKSDPKFLISFLFFYLQMLTTVHDLDMDAEFLDTIGEATGFGRCCSAVQETPLAEAENGVAKNQNLS